MSCDRNAASYRRIARVLWQSLVVALLVVLTVPWTGDYSLWFGPPEFWLLAMPGVSLLLFYRHALAAAWRGSVRLPFPGVRNATHLEPLPGGRCSDPPRR